MNGSTAALFFGILIIAICSAWVLSGGLASPAQLPAAPDTAKEPAATPVPVEATAKVQVTTTAPPVPETRITAALTPATTAPPVITTPVSSDMARDHFLDIAYSPTNRLERLNYSEDEDRLVISVVTPDKGDTGTISGLIKEFNTLSRSVTFSENIKESDNGDIVIKFLPENGMESIILSDIPDAGPEHEVLTRREIPINDKPACKVVRGTVYFNSDLKDDERDHAIARCIYYELGVTGETADYPDSLFYAGENTNTEMNDVDRRAVAILYEPDLANTMTMLDLRKVIYIP